MKKLRIGFVSSDNPDDKRIGSGTPYKTAQMLTAMGHEVVWVKKTGDSKAYGWYERIIRRICWHLLRGNVMPMHTLIGAWFHTRMLDRKAVAECDLLFAPMASSYLATLKTDKPVIYLSDATFGVMVDYYDYLSGLAPWAVRQGNLVEQRAMDRASAIVLCSDWARRSALSDYHQPTEKVHVVELGANLEEKDIVDKHYHYDGTLHLLFLGVNWIRKGGDIAVEACRYLNEHNQPAVLHIVGIRDLSESAKGQPWVVDHGFLDKNNPVDYAELVKVIQICHCLLLPTLAECAGIAFCESSAYGLPAFTHETGGTGNYVFNGRNGYLLPLGSTGEDFGRKIEDCLKSGELERMAETAKQVYHERLNWNVWSDKMKAIIEEVMSK